MAESVYKAVGDGTDVGLLNFLQDADIPIHLLINKKMDNILMTSPFSPETKRSSIALKCPDRPGYVSIYIKGAPEILLDLCAKIHMGSVERTLEIGPDEKAKIIDHIDKMAKQALRVVGFAFIELSFEQWNQNFANDESEMLPRCDPNEPYYLSTSQMFEEKLG